MRTLKQLWQDQQGQALVEFAITISLLLLLIIGGSELTRLIHVFLVATNAAREGARTAALGYDYEVAVNKVNEALGAWADKTHTIEITPVEDHRKAGEPIQVKVIVPVPLMTPILSNIVSNPFPVQSAVTMRTE